MQHSKLAKPLSSRELTAREALTQRNTTQAAIERVILNRDLRSLTEIERVQYNFALCRSLGLNPLTNPIDYLVNEGKMTPYINANGVSGLRAIHGISTKITNRTTDAQHLHYVTAVAVDANGRSEESTAIVALTDKYGKQLLGQRRADKMMAAETKAKRRATLSLVGIPWADGGTILSSRTYDPPHDVLPLEDEF
ncbi:hypothetical protein [Myxosarcina sp. GI1]|uniref:hypothetical protein n=1 Tax=Myxosarcina sp. GI1 TaxID=1541065 RepID=UPI00055C5B45|nr:hypothetical protein [Myxosarcina sp. GI1]